MTASASDPASGCLWVVSTPIGNLEDITARALSVLASADAVLAEDTRRTRRLLRHYNIPSKVSALHAHTADKQLARYLEQLETGAQLALVTDAGTPVVSDPGFALVEGAHELGVPVRSVPGPSALTAAISIAAVSCAEFRFVGFLPRKGQRRGRSLDAIASANEATVFFESPLRLAATLEALAPRIGERVVAVCRELTKIHEEVRRGSASDLARLFADGTKGEVTVVVEGADAAQVERWDDVAIRERASSLAQQGLPPSQIAKLVAKESGVRRADVFKIITRAENP